MGVRAYVPYANYRGQVTGKPGESEWAPIVPALKEYAVADAVDLRAGATFDFDAYLAAPTSKSPLETWEDQLRHYILDQGLECETLASAQPRRSIVPEALPYLRATYPAPVARDLGSGADLPALLVDQVRISLDAPNLSDVLDYQASLASLYGARITLTSEPATEEDAQIIDAFGGLEQTPLYLVKLRATLRVDGDIVAQGPAQTPGVDNRMTVKLRRERRGRRHRAPRRPRRQPVRVGRGSGHRAADRSSTATSRPCPPPRRRGRRRGRPGAPAAHGHALLPRLQPRPRRDQRRVPVAAADRPVRRAVFV